MRAAWMQLCSLRAHLHPGLLVQVGHVELAAGRVGQALVVFLKDLVETLGRKQCIKVEMVVMTLVMSWLHAHDYMT